MKSDIPVVPVPGIQDKVPNPDPAKNERLGINKKVFISNIRPVNSGLCILYDFTMK